MRTAAMSCMKISDADSHNDEALRKPRFSSLLDGRHVPVHFLRVLSRDARLMAIWLNQEAGGVCQAADIRALLEVVFHTPPQVDTSTYRYIRKKARTYAVGTWRWRIFSLLVLSRHLPISSPKKSIAQAFPGLVAYYGVRDTASLRLFWWVMRDHADRAISPTYMSPLFFEQPRVNVISRPVSPTALSQYSRRES
ncbi:MAG: hypothetical protein H0U76_23210 [Ktedonobacteraceae bacterium]|nr:hypothetical protein [Ktedonobacteraceae bacterium]